MYLSFNLFTFTVKPVTAFCNYYEMESIDSPSAKLITDKDEAMTSCHTSHEKYSWLLEMSQNISENIIGDQFETATSQTPHNFRDG